MTPAYTLTHMDMIDRRLLIIHGPLTGNLQSRWRLTFGALLVFLSLLAALVFCWIQLYQDVQLHRRGVVATGEVISTGPTSKRPWVTVRLSEPADREVRFQVRSRDAPAVGDRLAMRYDPAHPARAQPAAAGINWFLLVGPIVSGLPLLFLAWRDMTLHRRIGDGVNRPYRENTR